MDNSELTKMAYSMEAAYRKNPNMGDACHEVAEEYPDSKDDSIRAMWLAIDAFVGLNT